MILWDGRLRLNETAAINTAIATDAAAIQLIASIDEFPTAIPPIPAAAAMLKCKMAPNRLSMIPEASGASKTRLYWRPGPDNHAAHK